MRWASALAPSPCSPASALPPQQAAPQASCTHSKLKTRRPRLRHRDSSAPTVSILGGYQYQAAPFTRSSLSQTARLRGRPNTAASLCLGRLHCHRSSSTALQTVLPQQATEDRKAKERNFWGASHRTGTGSSQGAGCFAHWHLVTEPAQTGFRVRGDWMPHRTSRIWPLCGRSPVCDVTASSHSSTPNLQPITAFEKGRSQTLRSKCYMSRNLISVALSPFK